MDRISSGIPALDDILGGGFFPGKKVIIYGATGVGKTSLGVTFAHAGIEKEGHPGIIFNISTRDDGQAHLKYARDFFGWNLKDWNSLTKETDPREFRDYAYNSNTLDFYCDEYIKKGRGPFGSTFVEEAGTSYLRYHLPKTHRLIIDGSNDYENTKESIKNVSLFFQELSHHRYALIFKDQDEFPIDNQLHWNATTDQDAISSYVTTGSGNVIFGKHKPGGPDTMDVESKRFIWDRYALRPNGPHKPNVRKDLIDPDSIVKMYLQTTQARDVFKLINRDVEKCSLDAEVSTVVVMGYFPVTPDNPVQRRGLAVLKHRGSNYIPSVFEYQITDNGIQIL